LYRDLMTQVPKLEPGPFTADMLKPGDRYELSNGHAVYCAPAGGPGARGSGLGFEVIDSDPDVESAGVDAGFSPKAKMLRAPDVSVGVPDRDGWIQGVPPLAIEYAGTGQDEASLQEKISDLLEAGSKYIWVVRLATPRHVEVHVPGAPFTVKEPGELLVAAGVLKNPVRVEALWDRKVAHESTLRNLLQRAGYESLDAVREEGREEGRKEAREEGRERGSAEALLLVLASRGFHVDDTLRARVFGCHDAKQLQAWLQRAVTADTIEAVFA
jgi:Uma2 family endonuclease